MTGVRENDRCCPWLFVPSCHSRVQPPLAAILSVGTMMSLAAGGEVILAHPRRFSIENHEEKIIYRVVCLNDCTAGG